MSAAELGYLVAKSRLYGRLVRGRVSAAIFTCPYEPCLAVIRYSARQRYAVRCPQCRRTIVVGLILRLPTRAGNASRPPDSIIPVADGQQPTDALAAEDDGLPEVAYDPLPSITALPWPPGSPANTAVVENDDAYGSDDRPEDDGSPDNDEFRSGE